MPDIRRECLESMRQNISVPVEMLYWQDWYSQILREYPLHEGFKYLSLNHRSDYLRCYFMHFFGGGYSDIKYYDSSNNWDLCFNILNSYPSIEVIGEPEAMQGSPIKEYNERSILPKLISVCSFICRPRSTFTTLWYDRLIKKMDEFYPRLKYHPATDVFGRNPGYPVPWAAIGAGIIHPLIIEFRESHRNAIVSALQSGRNRAHKWGGVLG